MILQHGLDGSLLPCASFHFPKVTRVNERDQRSDSFLSIFRKGNVDIWGHCIARQRLRNKLKAGWFLRVEGLRPRLSEQQ